VETGSPRRRRCPVRTPLRSHLRPARPRARGHPFWDLRPPSRRRPNGLPGAGPPALTATERHG